MWIAGSAGRVTGPMDESAGGRVMSDTTCIFILDAYQVYLNTADLPFVKATWPHLVRAAQWQINRTIEGNGFPHHLQVCFTPCLAIGRWWLRTDWHEPCLQNTYDYLGLDKYPNAAYSGFTHLAAMRAMVKMAKAVGDSTGLSAECDAR